MPFEKKKISAYQAMYEAQKIAYAPVIFQAVRALRDLGILSLLENSRKQGLSAKAIGDELNISQYGVETLLETGLSCDVVEYDKERPEPYKQRVYFLSKVGYYILHDPMTVTNMDFNQHICYHPMAELERAIVDGKPRGMAVLGGKDKTFYEQLPHLPEVARESWYKFDHLYSDTSYPLILPVILSSHPKTLADIGTNTGKFPVVLAEADPDISITIIDLPDQLENAKATAAKAGFSDRINPVAMDLLNDDEAFPKHLDVYWMSQFLSCFGADEIVSILRRVNQAMKPDSRVFIMETCWDRQQHEAAAFSLVNTSPYFACIASGNSKMYHSEELILCVEKAGLEVVEITDKLGICHSLFECQRRLT